MRKRTRRTKQNEIGRVDCIFTADWHLRLSTPSCRTDEDFFSNQISKVAQILELSHENGHCPVVVAGDVGHRPQWENLLLTEVLGLLREYEEVSLCLLPGQHDLPYHVLVHWRKGGLGVLNTLSNILVFHYSGQMRVFPDYDLCFFPFGCEIRPPKVESGNHRRVAIAHTMAYKGRPEWPGQDKQGNTAKNLLKNHPEYDLIVTGDNHTTFVETYKDRLLVNPGSLLRATADQANHRPCVFLWDAERNQVIQKFLKVKKGVIETERVEREQKRNERIEAFVARLGQQEKDVSLSFEDNLKKYLSENKVPKSVSRKIWNAVED